MTSIFPTGCSATSKRSSAPSAMPSVQILISTWTSTSTSSLRLACALRIAQVLEPYNMHWLEIDRYDPDALLQIKQSTTTKICTGENLYYMHDYIPYFERHAADVFMIDVPWNGFSQS